MTRSENELRAAYREPPDPAVLTRLRASIEELAEPAAPSRRSRRRWLAPMVAAVAVIAVFATITVLVQNSHHHAAARPGGAVSAALRLWADFPVDASPRPLVLTGPDILGPGGRVSRRRRRQDCVYLWQFRAEDDAADGAGGRGRAAGDVGGAGARPAPLGGRGQAGQTDVGDHRCQARRRAVLHRSGTRSLPAWSFRFASVTNPALVLAVPTTDRWPQPGMPTSEGGEGGVSISGDGSRVTLSFVGAAPGTGPCQAEYTADVSESATAVSISRRGSCPHRGNSGGNDQQESCDLVGYTRTVTVTLHTPLGNRVVIDSRGVPLPASK